MPDRADNLRLLQGDAREMLRTLPAESVQCAISSPPYWGLRAYGTEPQIWGGDSACEHQWHNERYYTEQTAAACSADAFSEPGEANAQRLKEGRWRDNCWCLKCGAWRGELGLEPTPELYVEHIVAVFREVRRVLRGDGTCWVNLGDCYAHGIPGGGCPFANGRTDGRTTYEADKARGREKVATMADGLKPKDLVGIPWLVAFALRADGWWLRQDIIWSKPNPMPESVTDRCTKAHEYLLLLTKSARYFYDAEAVKEETVCDRMRGPALHPDLVSTNGNDGLCRRALEPMRNKRSVWEIATAPFPEAHFATFPPKLVEPCILAGTSEKGCCPECGAPWERVVEKDVRFESGSGKAGNPPNGKNGSDYEQALSGDYDIRMGPVTETRTLGWQPACKCGRSDAVPCVVLDPFGGAGTTGLVARRLGRRAILIELKPEYAEMARRRIIRDAPLFNRVTNQTLEAAD